jgi:hypothetical protein
MKRVTLLIVLFAAFLFPCVCFGILIEVTTTGTLHNVAPVDMGRNDPFGWDGQAITTTAVFDPQDPTTDSHPDYNYYHPFISEYPEMTVGVNSVIIHGGYLLESKNQVPYYFQQHFEGPALYPTGIRGDYFLTMTLRYAFDTPYPNIEFEGSLLVSDYELPMNDAYYEIALTDISFTPIDNSQPVPEPATIFLLGAGVIGFVGYSGKRSKSCSVKFSKN